MHPVLFQIPAFPAWVAALLAALLGGVFWWFGRKDAKDRGSWWLAGICGVVAVWLLLHFKPTGPVGPLPIRFFGILVVLGFLAAAKIAAMRNRRLGLLSGEESFDLAFYVLLAGLVGARLFHVVQHATDENPQDHLPEYAGRIWKALYIWDGGLTWYGGALFSTLFAWYWLAKNKKDLWSISDSLALAVPVGHAIGRIGCFMAGCDYGRVVPGGKEEVPWAVHFPRKDEDPNTLVPADMSYDAENDKDLFLHPAQLYEALALLLVFGILWWVDRKSPGKPFRGRLVALYMMLYAVARIVVEHWRGDTERGTYFGGAVSFSQILSALAFVAGIMMYNGLKGRAAGPGAQAGAA
jgi:phosphatidylglycerol:prolipoprotein diacylglycerol transferase